MPEISDRAKAYVSSPIRKIAAMLEKAALNRNIISFGGGAPSLAPPQEVVDYVISELGKDPQKKVNYCSTPGLPKTRQLIAENMKDEEKIDIDPDEIIMTVGGTEALFVTIQSLVNPGEEVIISDPTYAGYFEMVKVCGGKTVKVPVKWQEHFQLFPDKVNEAITKKTKMILLLTPDNPTGRILDKENLKGIVELAEDKNLWLITDDIYKDIIFEGKFYNSRLFGGYENTVTCCSFSKSASIPGIRVGYAYGPKEVVRKISEIKQSTSLTAPRFALFFVDKFLENNAKIKKEYISKTVVPTYKMRRDFMAECFKKHLPHVEYSMPKGAFYFFVDFADDLKKLKMDDEEFSNELFEQKSVVVIPGKYFGNEGKNHLRITFVSETKERIGQGMEKIGKFISS